MAKITTLKRKERENTYKGIALPDNVKEQTRQHSESEFESLLKQYVKFLEEDTQHVKEGAKPLDQMVKEPIESLTPEKINAFLMITSQYQDHHFYGPNTGLFVSRLIRQSFYDGNNNFRLETYDIKNIGNLGSYLEGTIDKKIMITIDGNAGDNFGSSSKHCWFVVNGDLGAYTANFSEICRYEFSGDIDYGGGESLSKCLFITTNRESYKALKEMGEMIDTQGDNFFEIILKNKKGKIIKKKIL